MKRAARFLSSMILTLLLAGLPVWGAENLDQMKRQRESLNQKIREYNELARKKEQQAQSILGQLTQLRQDAQASRTQMETLEREGRQLKSDLGSLTQTQAEAEAALKELLDRLRGHVDGMYRLTSQQELQILLSAPDAHEALNTAYMLGRFLRRDQALVEELVARSETLSQSRAELEQKRAQMQIQTEELKRRRQEFDRTIQKTDALLRDVQGQRKKAQAAAQDLMNAQREIGERILALTRRVRGAKTSPQAPAQPAPVAQASGTQTQAAQPQAPAQAAAQPPQPASRPKTYAYLPKGTPLEWPVRGPVSASFGSRVHPVFKTKVFNSGIDIKAASGAQVRAAGPGEVLFNGWIRGFGEVVIVDHGGDISTVYAHLASALVREGDAVRTGSPLGTVGNSGSDTAYGLHFEVRIAGKAQNPMNYLRKI